MEIFTELTPAQINAYTQSLLALFAFLLFAAIFWFHRRDIGCFLRDNLKKIQIKIFGHGGEADFGKDNKPEIEAPNEESKEEQIEPEDEAEEESEPAPDKLETMDDWKWEMFRRALMSKDEKQVTEAYEKAFALAESENDRHTLSIFYADVVIRYLNNERGIEQLDEYCDSKKYDAVVVEKALAALAFVRLFLKDYSKSIQLYERAINISDDADNKCFYECQIAQNLFNSGRKDDAFEKLEKLLVEYSIPKQQAKIYERLADFYQEENRNELRALAVEKVIELGEEENSNYFNAAYSYSHSGFDKLSLLHYQKALKLGSGEGSINNLGVQYDQLGMPILSIEKYQAAFKEDETLSAANMAYRLIQAGFIKEAENLLEEAKKKDNVHENVYKALALLKSKREEEEKEEAKILAEATQQREFLQEYAKCYFTKATAPVLDVNYFPERDTNIHVEIKDDKIIGTWSVKRYSRTSDFKWTEEHKFEGEMHNNAAKVVFYKTALTDDDFEKDTEGLLYIQDSEHIKILLQSKYNEQDYQEVELIKKV